MNRQQDFYNMYRSRYYQRFYNHMGAIPDLPAEYGNANDRYHLLAWLHRAFKHLLDDFVELELEFEQFKNDLLETIEVLIPEIIREYTNSKEFHEKIETIIKEWFEKNVEERLKEIEKVIKELQDKVKDLQKQIDDINKKIDDILKTLDGLLGGGFKRLTKDKDYQVVFHNDFYTDSKDISVGVIELTDRYIIKVYSSYFYETFLENDNIVDNFKLLHSGTYEDEPKSAILSINFINDYQKINKNSKLISSEGTGILNIKPVSARASWTLDYGLERDKINNYPFTICGVSYADGYNTNFTIYNQALTLEAGNMIFNMTLLKDTTGSDDK